MNNIIDFFNENMTTIAIVITLAILVILVMMQCRSSKENLRIRGSFDLRGDPYIPRVPTGPWNQGTSVPIQRRRMVIGETY